MRTYTPVEFSNIVSQAKTAGDILELYRYLAENAPAIISRHGKRLYNAMHRIVGTKHLNLVTLNDLTE